MEAFVIVEKRNGFLFVHRIGVVLDSGGARVWMVWLPMFGLSRKLVSASWNLFCFKKVLGGWNFQPLEIHSYLPSSLPTVGTSPLAAHSAGSASSASVCFHAKFLTKLTFVPYKLTFVLNYRASTTRPCANAGNIIENNRKNNWKL